MAVLSACPHYILSSVSMHALYPVSIHALYPVSMHVLYPVSMQADLIQEVFGYILTALYRDQDSFIHFLKSVESHDVPEREEESHDDLDKVATQIKCRS